jgi:sterol regulatory element-binding transcription factor 1
MFMLAVFVLNPFSKLLKISESSENLGEFDADSGRKILSWDEGECRFLSLFFVKLMSKLSSDAGYFSWQNITSTFALWVFNLIFLIACLAKMLVYGDPILKHQSNESSKYWKHKKQSDLEFERVRRISR